LGDGTYRIRLHVTVYSALYEQPTPEVLANHPAEWTFQFESTSGLFECKTPPPVSYSDPRTPGYWKNHPEAWLTSSVSVGGTSYSQACLIDFFDAPTRGDVRVILIHHLVAAKLNLLTGTDPSVVTGYPNASSTIGNTIAAADAFLAAQGTLIDCSTSRLGGTVPRDAAKDVGEAIKNALDWYNNRD
jgi:hypothetical protein